MRENGEQVPSHAVFRGNEVLCPGARAAGQHHTTQHPRHWRFGVRPVRDRTTLSPVVGSAHSSIYWLDALSILLVIH